MKKKRRRRTNKSKWAAKQRSVPYRVAIDTSAKERERGDDVYQTRPLFKRVHPSFLSREAGSPPTTVATRSSLPTTLEGYWRGKREREREERYES